MSTLIDTIQNAQRRAVEIRPAVGGFPVVAEVLRQAGIRRNEWALPAGQTGHTTFPQFLAAVWSAGVTGYVVDLEQRTVTYRGIDNAIYVETYPAVEI
jgi:uncharacterized protein YbcV (DUF1398 family)